MPSSVALIICIGFVSALFIMDQRWRPKTSATEWIPLVWVLIIGSRPVTLWIFPPSYVDSPETIMEGSPVDRAFYLAMILAGLLVLLARRFKWMQFAAADKWVVLYFAYLGLSILWSDYSFIAFKRWIKDLGNLVMVLIVLTESNPAAAVKALLVRASYILIPLSVVLVKYFPELARHYDLWTGKGYFSGVALNKNMLGMTLTALALGLLWALLDAVKKAPRTRKWSEILVYTMLLMMALWLLLLADSATALACIVAGGTGLLFLQARIVRARVHAWVTIGVLAALLLAVPDVRLMVLEPVVGLLGRNISFTDRDEVWQVLLQQDINPIIGVGSYSFWMGARVEHALPGLQNPMNTAHNAYIEIYLNVGLLGLLLFLAILANGTVRAIREVARDSNDSWADFRLAFLIVTALYGVTEATINRLDLIWMGLLLVVVRVSIPEAVGRSKAQDVAAQGRSLNMRRPGGALAASGRDTAIKGAPGRPPAKFRTSGPARRTRS